MESQIFETVPLMHGFEVSEQGSVPQRDGLFFVSRKKRASESRFVLSEQQSVPLWHGLLCLTVRWGL